ncbi:MAG: hypothetical protein K8T25_06410 [Planctomycetia bacterium]|nr:hypothetical protein [Planctomycetia bacterium]
MNVASTFFQTLKDVREALAGKQPRDAIHIIMPRLQDPAVFREFFRNLDDPAWIEPLAQEGVFDSHFSPEIAEFERTQFCSPRFDFLVRMAQKAPQPVASIFQRIETKQPFMIRAILEGAASMPAPIAATLVPKLCKAFEASVLGIGFVDAAKLSSRLAQEGAPGEAMILARCLFTIRPERETDTAVQRDDDWYIGGLEKAFSSLVASQGEVFLKLLLDGLQVIVEQKAGNTDSPGYDLSPWWRPAIEEHEENPDYDFASQYVGCVRQALEFAIRNGQVQFHRVLELLEQYPWLIFKRLRLHLINNFASDNPELAKRTILDESLFENYRYKHEYARLCEQHFSALNDTDKVEWLSWIDRGPDMSSFDESIRSGLKREPTADDRVRRIEYWQFEKLHWIRAHLVGSHREFYVRMLAEHGEPRLADVNVSHGRLTWGEESPYAVDELLQKRFLEVVEIVCKWRPGERDNARQSAEGLARAFKEYLASANDRFIGEAHLMVGRPALFVRTYLDAVREIVGKDTSLNLSPLIGLCNWVLQRPTAEDTSITEDSSYIDDRTWQGTRDAISELLRTACQQSVSLSYRADVWQLIVPLTRDSADSYIVESADIDPRIRDYANLSMNSPCGKAMSAVFAYMRWIAEAVASESQGRKLVSGGLGQMPEVRKLLEGRLAPDDAGKFSLRATYGWFWSLLYWIDKEWLSEHAGQICDLQRFEIEPTKAYGWAAWNSFLTSTPAHIDYYRLLRPQFSYAVDQAASLGPGHDVLDRPFDSLAEHLILLYGRGHLTLESDGAIVQRLLKNAATPIRTHAIQFIGAALWREDSTNLPIEFRDRFAALWDWYWPNVGVLDAREAPTSGVFSYWFVSGAFDPSWALARLEEFVSVVPKPELHEGIVEKLAEIGAIDLSRTLVILDHLIEGDDDNWRIYSWKENAKKILALAMQRGGQLRSRATETIDRLGRRGFVEFGELLDIVAEAQS